MSVAGRVRFFSSKASQRPTKVIENLLKQHGPQTANTCWKLAQPAGIKSKSHMKTMLHWLVERDRVKIKCNHLKQSSSGSQKKGGHHKGREQKSGQGAKEFLFGIKEKGTKTVKPDILDPNIQENSTEMPVAQHAKAQTVTV